MVTLRKTAALGRSKLSVLISILLLGATAGCTDREIGTAVKLGSLVVVGAVAVTGIAVGAAAGAAAGTSDKDGTNRCRVLRFGRAECERREQERKQEREREVEGRYQRAMTEYETRIASAFAKRTSEAECGNALEQYNLGIMFWIGTEPATEDPVAAYMWLSLAASNGLAEAKQSRNRLAAKMIAAQIAAAESLVGAWEPNQLCARPV